MWPEFPRRLFGGSVFAWLVFATPAEAYEDIGGPELLFSYPSETSGSMAASDVLWVVGSVHTRLVGVFIDGGTWFDAAAPEPPDNWLLRLPEPLAPGRHTLEIALSSIETIHDQSATVTFAFEVIADSNSGTAPVFTPLEFDGAVRYVESIAGPADADRTVRLALPGDCTEFVEGQYDPCVDGEFSHDPGWLWTSFSPASNALGYFMAGRFVPAECRSLMWPPFEGPPGATPLYRSGFGATVDLADSEIEAYVPPPAESDPGLRSYGSSGCSVAHAGRRHAAAMCVLAVLTLRLRRAKPSARPHQSPDAGLTHGAAHAARGR